MTSPSVLFRLAAVSAGLAVVLGAFGAHALEARLESLGTEQIWETAVFYHLVHSVAVAALTAGRRLTAGQAWCFLGGILCFSGSLYLLSFKWLASVIWPVTPAGGLLLIGGWLWLAVRPTPFTRQS